MTARRDPGYDPRTMRPFVPGSSPSFDLSVNWPDLSTVSAPKQKASDLEAFFYEPGNREMLHYQPDPRTSITSLYPPPGMPETSNGTSSKVAETSATVALPSEGSPPHR